jgi:hypothetical protein
MDTLIYTWAGVVDIDPTSRADTKIYGNVIGDARKLATPPSSQSNLRMK